MNIDEANRILAEAKEEKDPNHAYNRVVNVAHMALTALAKARAEVTHLKAVEAVVVDMKAAFDAEAQAKRADAAVANAARLRDALEMARAVLCESNAQEAIEEYLKTIDAALDAAPSKSAPTLRRDCEQWDMGCNLPKGHSGRHSVEWQPRYLDEPCTEGEHDTSRSQYGSRICAKCDATAREESPQPTRGEK